MAERAAIVTLTQALGDGESLTLTSSVVSLGSRKNVLTIKRFPGFYLEALVIGELTPPPPPSVLNSFLGVD